MRPFSRSPKARAEVEAYVVPDGTCFLFDLTREEGFALDQLGALVWDYCDGQTAEDDIVAEVAALLPDHPEVVTQTRELLASFAAQGLLEPDTLGPAPGAAPSQAQASAP